MKIPAIGTTPPTPPTNPVTKDGPNVGATPPVSVKNDTVNISAEGHQTLQQAQAAAALATQQAVQAGNSLKNLNPARFKQADMNGNGKLSAKEAEAAGLIK